MGRPLLVALFAVIALMVVSWTLGEFLQTAERQVEIQSQPRS